MFSFQETEARGPSAGGSSCLYVSHWGMLPSAQPPPQLCQQSAGLSATTTATMFSKLFALMVPTLSDGPPTAPWLRDVSPGYKIFASSTQWKHWQGFFPPLFSKRQHCTLWMWPHLGFCVPASVQKLRARGVWILLCVYLSVSSPLFISMQR